MRFIAFFLLTGIAPLSALLPPLYQDIAEIDAILHNKAMADFSGEQLLSIIQEEDGYRLETSSHILSVKIKKLPSGIGPEKFEVFFQKIAPK